MDEIIGHVLFLLSRYLHLVCTTLLVGGTLFYEMVVPVAINDLRSEAQLGVFGRARWTFRGIVWTAGIVLIVSGIVSTVRYWDAYSTAENVAAQQLMSKAAATGPTDYHQPMMVRPGWWWVAHTSMGLIAVAIAMLLTGTRRPPERPVHWMRLNLVILLIVMFLGSVTLQARRIVEERLARPEKNYLPGV